MDTSVIIAAAGSSTRMNGIDKQLSEINGISVIGRTMLAFEKCESVFDIVVVSREENIPLFKKISECLNISKPITFVTGGNTRQESVLSGLKAISKETKFIAVHDGARPLVSSEKIEKVIADARIFGGATLGVPVKDTVKTVNGGLIVDTPDRSMLYLIQTPQVFRRSAYFDGVNFAVSHNLDFTDDCQLVEAIGIKVALTKGDYSNIKITTPEDIAVAEALLKLYEKEEQK